MTSLKLSTRDTLSRRDVPPSQALGETSMSQRMLSAVTGSILTSLLVTPLDVVRVRQQAQPSLSPSITSSPATFARLQSTDLGVTACCRDVFFVANNTQACLASNSSLATSANVSIAECAAEESRRRYFNSTFDGIRKIARNEGALTLWRGLSPTLVMAVPANVIYFAGYDWLRTNDKSVIKNYMTDAYAPVFAGSLARVAAAITVSPIEMLRTRMQATQNSNKERVLRTTISGIRDMVAENGYRSLWRGVTLTLWRDVPFSAFYWWAYEYGRGALHRLRDPTSTTTQIGREQDSAQLRRRVRDDKAHHSTVFIDSFITGAASGAIASFCTTPFDVGKTRQQTARHMKSSVAATANGYVPPENRSMPRFLWHIFQTEGLQGLFKGWAARCLKVTPACAIMISSYEVGKKMAASRANADFAEA